jgi:hypothetical protein
MLLSINVIHPDGQVIGGFLRLAALQNNAYARTIKPAHHVRFFPASMMGNLPQNATVAFQTVGAAGNRRFERHFGEQIAVPKRTTKIRK